MTKFILTVAISALSMSGAFACEHDRQAAVTDRTTVACAGGTCQATQPTAATTSGAGHVDEVVQDSERVAPSPVSLTSATSRPSNDK
jgi:hypothetical protein